LSDSNVSVSPAACPTPNQVSLKSDISSETDPDAGARRWPVESDRGEHLGRVGLAVLQAEPVDMARPDSCSMSSSEQGEHLSVHDLLDLCIGEKAPQSLVDLFTVHA
jgi:hypothetical protein